MKKVLCLLLVVLTLLSTLTVFVGAESNTTPSVMQELAGLRIDGKAFSESDFPLKSTDKNLYIIAAAEYKFRTVSSSPEFNLFFYVYNPSGMELKENTRNSIQIGMDEECQQTYFFGIKIYSKSEDNRFLKIGVVTSAIYSSTSLLLTKQKDAARRVYNVPTLRFVVNGKLESYPIKRGYIFEGYDYNDTLQGSWKELDVLQVELHTTNWISPNAGLKVDGVTEASVYDHYELHTVYFRVPKTYWEKYEYLYSIHATYDAVHLTPIIVTRKNDKDFADDEGQDTKNAILAGTSLKANSDLEVYDLGWQETTYSLTTYPKRHIYTDSDTLRNEAAQYTVSVGSWIYLHELVTKYNTLSYYFATLPSDFEYTDGAAIVKAAVSQKQLQEYFYDRYDKPLFDNANLYTEYISNQDLTKSAIEFKAEGIYKMTNFQEILNTKSLWEQWFTDWLTEDDSPLYDTFANEVQHITVLKEPGVYSNVPLYGDEKVEEVAEELFISGADMVEFSEVCKEAAAEGDYVVLLRVGFNDYGCYPVRDHYEAFYGTGPYVAVAVDKWAYMNVNVADLVFTKAGQNYIVPVSSNTVDSFGNVDAFGDSAINGIGDLGDDDGFDWEKLKKILLLAGICLVILVVITFLMKFIKPKQRIEFVMPNDTERKRKRRKRE